jgi:hypothetical protein
MCAIGDEFGGKHVFFMDLCGAYAQRDEVRDVVRWLDGAGQDVQLHAHPEYLPGEFWPEHNFKFRPRFILLTRVEAIPSPLSPVRTMGTTSHNENCWA